MYQSHMLSSIDGYNSDVSRPLNIPVDGAYFGEDYYKIDIDWAHLCDTSAKAVLAIGLAAIVLVVVWENVQANFPALS